MPIKNIFQHVSQAPTNPKPGAPAKIFDVAELYTGPVDMLEAKPDSAARSQNASAAR